MELRAADILDLPDELGSFDYVVAHGLYSWVPEEVRRKALCLIKHSLAPEGIAFVSYNAYPGWHELSLVRDMMLYRTRNISNPKERAQTARSFVALVAHAQRDDSPFAQFVRQYSASLHGRGNVPESQFISTLIHDELSDINQPFYFSEFVDHVHAQGLEFLAEADLEGSTPVGMDSDVIEGLSSFTTSRVEMEQYVDFIRNRRFRRTLLCHQDAPVSRTLNAGAQALRGMYIGSFAGLKRAPEDPPGMLRFETPDGVSYATDQPLLQAAFHRLGEIYPQVTLFEDLLARAREAAGSTAAQDGDALAAALIRNFLHSRSLVAFYVAPRPLVVEVSERPLATGFARFIAGQDTENATNVRHEPVQMTLIARALVPLWTASVTSHRCWRRRESRSGRP